MGFHESLAHELLAEEVEGVPTTLVCPYIVNTTDLVNGSVYIRFQSLKKQNKKNRPNVHYSLFQVVFVFEA